VTIETPPKTNLLSLQAGRGIAALLVVLLHATLILAAPQYWGADILGGLFRFGYAGVEFFFVLSGFIMAHIHWHEIGRTDRLRPYAVKRVVRIYPIYWVVLTPVMAWALLANVPIATNPLQSYALAGPTLKAYLQVAWTLFHEILFYALFALLFLSRRLGLAVLAMWLAACTLWLNREPPHYALDPINLLFGFGIAASLLAKRVRGPLALLVGGATAFLVLGVDSNWIGALSEDERYWAFGLAAAVAIVGAVKAELGGRITVPRWLALLGDASYALYLIHYPLLTVAARAWFRLGLDRVPAGIAFVLLVALCVAAGIALHLFVEKPLLRLLRGRRRAEPTLAEDRPGT
jgi:exopolysaccharide production protein ExoZ